jgi:hypothetical protein
MAELLVVVLLLKACLASLCLIFERDIAEAGQFEHFLNSYFFLLSVSLMRNRGRAAIWFSPWVIGEVNCHLTNINHRFVRYLFRRCQW